MATQDVKTAYETAKADIANLLGFFECELSKERTVVQWGWVETLNKVKNDLIETLSFMSGISQGEIKETLEECRMDVQQNGPQADPYDKAPTPVYKHSNGDGTTTAFTIPDDENKNEQ